MKTKGRPRKKKIIQQQPRIESFSPANQPGRLDEVILTLEEYDALRLHDHLTQEQKNSAKMMGISQQSFSRLLRSARKKVSDAIVNAKVIKIEGGDFISKRSMTIAEKIRKTFFRGEHKLVTKAGRDVKYY
jgi:predicted DNA-binding protein (UPF0251 family)